MQIYYIVINTAYYMFRPPTVAIFREVFFGGILYRTLKLVNLLHL